ncbi:MAG: Flp family type IVb pilin [Chloroflexi bacterium]|nr:MAG: Flp family type IVb pilin [Chloroflexota bacterium]
MCRRSASGQGLVEYGLVMLLVAVACAAALTTFQGTISSTITGFSSSF